MRWWVVLAPMLVAGTQPHRYLDCSGLHVERLSCARQRAGLCIIQNKKKRLAHFGNTTEQRKNVAAKKDDDHIAFSQGLNIELPPERCKPDPSASSFSRPSFNY
jgi:hypothetical protein